MENADIISFLAGITSSLIQIFKITFKDDISNTIKRFIPIASVIIGILLASLFFVTIKDIIINGIIIGLTACGIYSSIHAIKK